MKIHQSILIKYEHRNNSAQFAKRPPGIIILSRNWQFAGNAPTTADHSDRCNMGKRQFF